MSIVDGTKLDPNLNFRTLQSTRSFPQVRKVFPANSGQRTLNLTAGSGLQNVIFNIPAECINMGESFLEYKYTVDAQVINPGPVNKYTWIYKDVHGEIDSCIYRDTGTMSIVDVKNLHIYNQITNRLNFSDKDLEYNDSLNGLVRTNAPLSDVKCIRFDNSSCSVPFIEPQQMDLISAAGAVSAVQYKKIYLRDLIKDSYFGLAKNQILPIETYLELNFGNGNGRVGFASLSAVQPNSTPTALDGSIQITDLALNLCVEQNQELVKMLKAEVSKGISIPIPWVSVQQLQTNSASSSFVYNLSLDNKRHGQRIKRIIYAPLSTVAPSIYTLYDHSNTNGSKISQYQTELDNQKMQRDIVNVSASAFDDYMYHKKLLKGSLYYNKSVYGQNWVHVDSWDYGELHSEQNGAGHIMIDGLNLDKPMTWTFNALACTAADYNNTSIVVGQKILAINSSSYVVA